MACRQASGSKAVSGCDAVFDHVGGDVAQKSFAVSSRAALTAGPLTADLIGLDRFPTGWDRLLRDVALKKSLAFF